MQTVLVNCDYKLLTGIEAKQFKSLATHTLSPCQLAAGSDRKIYHRINHVRYKINAMSGHKYSGWILDNDYHQAFNFLVMLWVFRVLQAKGMDERVLKRLRNLYQLSFSS